jgi:hypothetical protein
MIVRTIWLHSTAPSKPAPGAPCNGCGVCCASAPCPLGMLASGRIAGRCSRLRFDDAASRYRCGLMPGEPRPDATWLTRALAKSAAAVLRRWIGAGIGCDSTAEAHAIDRAAH